MKKPYGHSEKTDKWAVIRKLKYEPNGHCLHWVCGQRCKSWVCQEGHGSRDWMDHVSGWSKDGGERILLCQPYHIGDVVSLAVACTQFGLRATIHGTGWYGHGTVALELVHLDKSAEKSDV